MAFTKLAGFSVLVTLCFRTLVILGESVLTFEIGKTGELKASDKRVNNFGVPMEMPFDTSFWPSRGRRGRRPETDICYSSDRTSRFAKQPLRCLAATAHQGRPSIKSSLADIEFNFSDDLDDHLSPGYTKVATTCCDPPPTALRGTLTTRTLIAPQPFHDPNKRPPHFAFPRLLLYGNALYWEPENPYGGKRKKQDVFWVARGKKNFSPK